MLRSPVVVGRSLELEAIQRALDGAQAGQGSCLFVVGEAGSGKTRLLQEARSEARRRNMTFLGGSVPPAVAPSAFGVLAQAIRFWSRTHALPVDELASFALGLHQVLPEWPAPPDPLDLSEAQTRLLVLEGLFRLLLVASREGGALLLLDDLHDADPETFEFLHHAVASINWEPLLVMGGVRSGEHRPGEAQVRTLGRTGQADIVEVGPLGEPEVAALAEAALGAPPPQELVADLITRTDGVPFLVEGMLEAHLEAGTLRRDNGSFRWRAEARAAVPPTILDVVRDKLGGLDEETRRVIIAGAVLGRFDADPIAVMTGLDATLVAASLIDGVGRGLLEAGQTNVAFRHALVRDAVLESLLPHERSGLHRRAAEALDALSGDDPDCLEDRAHHREGAGDKAAAAELLVVAARRNLDRHASASAEVLLRRALDLSPGGATADAAREALVEALGALGRWQEALGLDHELLVRSGEAPERLVRMARHAIWCGRLDEADKLLSGAGAAGAVPGPVLALSALAALWRGDSERAAEVGREALSAGEAEGNPEVVCSALDVVGRAVSILGRDEEAAAMFRRWAAVAEGAGLRMSHLQAVLELGNQQYTSGGPADGLRRARELAREAGAFTTLVLADLSLTGWLFQRARMEEALAVAEEAVDLCRRLRLDLLPHALAALGMARDGLAWGTGAPFLAEAHALAPGDSDILVLTEGSRGQTAVRAGRYEEAVEHLERSASTMFEVPSAVQDISPFLLSGTLLALGRRPEAETVLERAKGSPGVFRLYYNRPWLAAVEAMLSGTPAAFEDALAPLAESALLYRTIALVLGAEVMGGERAEGWLREALAVYQGAGCADDAGRIRALLGDDAGRFEAPAARERRTFMFTDIVGSTVLVEALGDESWGHLLRWHDETLRSLFVAHGGQEVKQVGDGFFVAFAAGPGALECAVAIQRALSRHRRDHGFAPQVRIGLHEAEATRKGDDYEGRGVHEAARISALAGAGEIVVSRSTLVGERGGQRWRTSSPRQVELKGLSTPVEVVSLEWQ